MRSQCAKVSQVKASSPVKAAYQVNALKVLLYKISKTAKSY